MGVERQIESKLAQEKGLMDLLTVHHWRRS